MKSFSEIQNTNDRKASGGKAENLCILSQNGLPVPEGFVLFPEDLKSEASLPSLIDQALSSLKTLGFSKFAIRSSANFEDSENASFAGIFESVLNLSSKSDILDAIQKCLDASKSERVVEYCKKNRIDPSKIQMALVLQGMLAPEQAGVLFTIDPRTGRDQTHLIEAVDGLAEELVQGVKTPDRFFHNWMSGEVTAKRNSALSSHLTDSEIRTLSDLAVQIQKYYGAPQDIEWALQSGKFYILQTRPITRIHFDVQEEWTNANMKDGGVASSVANPFILSMYRMMMNRTMPDYFSRMKMISSKTQKEWVGTFCSNIYWNLTATKDAVKCIPGFIEREFDQGLGIEPNYEGDGYRTPLNFKSILKGIQVLLAIKKSMAVRPKLSREVIVYGEKTFQEVDGLNLGALSDSELSKRARRLIDEDWFTIEGGYFYHIYDNSNCRTLFMKHLDRLNRSKKGDKIVRYLNLITNLGEIPHLKPLQELWDISRKARKSGIGSVQTELKAFIKEYRYRSERELDLLVTCWGEDSTAVQSTLNALMLLPDTESPTKSTDHSKALYEREVDKIKSSSIRSKLEQHRAFLKQREDIRVYSIKTFYLVRKVFMELGRRLQKQGAILAPDDIFYLPYFEALDFFNGEKRTELEKRLYKNQDYYQSYRNYKKPNEIRKKQLSAPLSMGADTSRLLRGVGCAPGKIEGVVCSIRSIHEIEKLKSGTVLVTEFVDPAWTLSFAQVKGLITETGGVLSHGAVIAREYGFPAILAVSDATRKLKDGMKVRMDGDSGEILILEDR